MFSFWLAVGWMLFTPMRKNLFTSSLYRNSNTPAKQDSAHVEMPMPILTGIKRLFCLINFTYCSLCDPVSGSRCVADYGELLISKLIHILHIICDVEFHKLGFISCIQYLKTAVVWESTCGRIPYNQVVCNHQSLLNTMTQISGCRNAYFRLYTFRRFMQRRHSNRYRRSLNRLYSKYRLIEIIGSGVKGKQLDGRAGLILECSSTHRNNLSRHSALTARMMIGYKFKRPALNSHIVI